MRLASQSTWRRALTQRLQQLEVNWPRAHTNTPSKDDTEPKQTTSHGLPLPPILNPAIQAARNRHKSPKQKQQEADRTPLQRELALNPYAQALATPLRACTVTETLLPKHQLQSFVTVFASRNASPVEPSQARQIYPAEPRKSSASISTREPGFRADFKTKSAGPEQLVPHLIPEPPGPSSAASTAGNARLKRNYTVLSRSLLQKLSPAGKGPAPGRRGRTWHWQRIISESTLAKYGVRGREAWVWDPETEGVVLEYLKEEVERGWNRCFRARVPKLVGVCKGLDCFDGKSELEPRGNGGQEQGDKQKPVHLHKQKPSRMTLQCLDPDNIMCFLGFGNQAHDMQRQVEDWVKKHNVGYIQCFDMIQLLGSERALALRTHRRIFRDACILAVRKDSLVMSAVLALMRLDAYLDKTTRYQEK